MVPYQWSYPGWGWLIFTTLAAVTLNTTGRVAPDSLTLHWETLRNYQLWSSPVVQHNTSYCYYTIQLLGKSYHYWNNIVPKSSVWEVIYDDVINSGLYRTIHEVSRAFQASLKGFQEAVKNGSRLVLGCFNGVSRVLQLCFKDVSKKCSMCLKEVSCCMALIAATGAEGGLVFVKF